MMTGVSSEIMQIEKLFAFIYHLLRSLFIFFSFGRLFLFFCICIELCDYSIVLVGAAYLEYSKNVLSPSFVHNSSHSLTKCDRIQHNHLNIFQGLRHFKL